jgi:hypothetical protein
MTLWQIKEHSFSRRIESMMIPNQFVFLFSMPKHRYYNSIDKDIWWSFGMWQWGQKEEIHCTSNTLWLELHLDHKVFCISRISKDTLEWIQRSVYGTVVNVVDQSSDDRIFVSSGFWISLGIIHNWDLRCNIHWKKSWNKRRPFGNLGSIWCIECYDVLMNHRQEE